MGHGQKNANRGEAIVQNKERVRRLSVKHGKLEEQFKKLQKTVVTLGKSAKQTSEAFIAQEKAMDELEHRVLFNEMPFYRRWYSRFHWWLKSWRGHEEIIDEPEITEEEPDEGTEEKRRPAEVAERSGPDGEGEGGLDQASDSEEEEGKGES